MSTTQLLDLPPEALLHILASLPPTDLYSRCSVAQTCTQLLRLAATQALWDEEHQHAGEGLIFMRIRHLLSKTLHLPPQAFMVQDDSKRSAKFRVLVPLYSLRGLLGVSEVEELAASTARRIQDRVDRISPWVVTGQTGTPQQGQLSHTTAAAATASAEQASSLDAQQEAIHLMPRHSIVQVCRSDRGTLRIALNPAATVRTVLDNQLSGLPLIQLRSPLEHPSAVDEPAGIRVAMLGTTGEPGPELAHWLPYAGEAAALPNLEAIQQGWESEAEAWVRFRRDVQAVCVRRAREVLCRRGRQGEESDEESTGVGLVEPRQGRQQGQSRRHRAGGIEAAGELEGWSARAPGLQVLWATVPELLLRSDSHTPGAQADTEADIEAQLWTPSAIRCVALLGSGPLPSAWPVTPTVGGVKTLASASTVPPASRGAHAALEWACNAVARLMHLRRAWSQVECHAAATAGAPIVATQALAQPPPGGSTPQPAPHPAAAPPSCTPRFACLMPTEILAAALHATDADTAACLRCLSHLTEAISRCAEGQGPAALLELLGEACREAGEYCSPPVGHYSALGVAVAASQEAYFEQLGRALASPREGEADDSGGEGGDVGNGVGEAGVGQGRSLARILMLRSCLQVALWSAWCLGMV